MRKLKRGQNARASKRMRLLLFLASALRRCQREAGGEGAAEGNTPQSKLAAVAGIGRGDCIVTRFITGADACTSAGMTW